MSVVKFRVKTPAAHRGFPVFVVGNCSELGNWTPHLAIPLQLHSSSETEDYWVVEVHIQSVQATEYRFFTGCELCTPNNRRLVTTQCWESFELPRRIVVSADEVDCGEAVFGCNDDGRIQIDCGWLTGQSEVQLRISNLCLRNVSASFFTIGCIADETWHHEVSEVNGQKSALHSPVFFTAFGLDGPHILPRNGIKYTGNKDFLTLKIHTCFANLLALKVSVSAVKENGGLSCIEEVGSVYLKLNSANKAEVQQLPVVTKHQEIVGTMDVDVLIINTLSDAQQLEGCFIPRRWNSSDCSLIIGHRGMGSSYIRGEKSARFPENTIRSLSEAAKNGADMVEFDVLLTRDEVPVVFHDFTGCIGALQTASQDGQLLEVSVVDLTYKELQSLKVQKCLDFASSFPSAEDERPFPTLQSCFEKVDPNVAFDIEVKYCMHRRETKQLEDNLKWFPERNCYIDIVINTILKHAGNRRIVLSCFDPDICMMLRIKQARFPVFFLSQGETKKYPAYLDPRAATLELAIEFAAAESLAGIAVHTEGLLKDLDLIAIAKSRNLAVLCWGTDNNSVSNLSLLRSRGVDGICYDKIDEFRGNAASSTG